MMFASKIAPASIPMNGGLAMNENADKLIEDPTDTKPDYSSPEVQRERELVLDSLKTKANNFLWVNLPPWTTMGEADDIACDITERIVDLWNDTPKNEEVSDAPV